MILSQNNKIIPLFYTSVSTAAAATVPNWILKSQKQAITICSITPRICPNYYSLCKCFNTFINLTFSIYIKKVYFLKDAKFLSKCLCRHPNKLVNSAGSGATQLTLCLQIHGLPYLRHNACMYIAFESIDSAINSLKNSNYRTIFTWEDTVKPSVGQSDLIIYKH